MPRRKPTAPSPAALGPGAEVWAYLRVSTTQQADKGLPIEGQRQAIQAYCQEHGYALTRIFIDAGISGATDDRDQFRLMVSEAQRQRPAAVLFWSWARFTRGEVKEADYYKAMLRYSNIELVSLADGIPAMDGLEYPLEGFIHWRDHQRLKEMGSQIKRGHHALARMGYLPSGDQQLPTGYRTVTVTASIGGREREARRIELDPATAPLVRRAHDMRLAGATFQEINTATGLFAYPNELGDMFRNPIYHTGRYSWNGTEIPVPAIISESEWQRVYDGLAFGRGGAYPQRKVSRYLLSGLVQCGVCGQPMKGHSSSRPHHLYCYYRCFTPGCAVRGIAKERLEELVIGKLTEGLLAAEELIRSGAATPSPDDGHEAQLQAMRSELAHKEAAIGRLLEALEVALEVREVAERLRTRTQERERLQRQIGELERAVVSVPTVEEIADLRERLEVGLRENPRQAKEIIAACLEAVTVESDGQATLRYRLPLCPQ